MANQKTTQLDAIASVASVDLVHIVDDPTGTPISKKATAEQLRQFMFGTASIDSVGTLQLAPDNIGLSNTRHGVELEWVDEASGQFLWPITINPLSALPGMDNDLARWGIQAGFTNFNTHTDYHVGIGLFGDGTTSEINYSVRESSYDIGGGITSHETYDVVQMFDWTASRRVGWGWSSFSPRNGNGGTIEGIAIFDNISFSTSDPNTANPSIGQIGQYFSINVTPTTGVVSAAFTSDNVSFTNSFTIAITSSGVANNCTGTYSMDVTGLTGVPYQWFVNSVSTMQLYGSARVLTMTAAGLNQHNEDLIQSADNDGYGEIRTRWLNTTTSEALICGVTSPTNFNVHAIGQGRAGIRGVGEGLAIYSTEAKPVIFGVNGDETARFGTTGKLEVAAGTTARAQINLASSTAPTTPADGDIWFDGTNLKIRVSGTTYTLTKT